MGGDDFDNDALCDKRSDLIREDDEDEDDLYIRGPLEAASSLQSDFPPLPTRGGYCHKNCPFCTIHGLSAASLTLYLLPALYIVQSQTAHHTSSPLGASAAYTHTVCCAQHTSPVLSEKQPLCVLHPTTVV